MQSDYANNKGKSTWGSAMIPVSDRTDLGYNSEDEETRQKQEMEGTCGPGLHVL